METLFARLVELLPRLKTRLQFFGVVVMLGAYIIVRQIAPNATKAQLTAGAVGIAFIVFGKVFSVLKDIPANQRAALILGLFVVFCCLVIFLTYATSRYIGTASVE